MLIFSVIASELPAVKSEGRELFSVPLLHLFSSPHDVVQHIFNVMLQESYADIGLFKELSKSLYENACRASGINPYGDIKKLVDWILKMG